MIGLIVRLSGPFDNPPTGVDGRSEQLKDKLDDFDPHPAIQQLPHGQSLE
jgi:hypothetical protein